MVLQYSIELFSAQWVWRFRRNDILRARGILPPKNEKTAEEIEDMYVEALQARRREEESLDNKTLDELDELEDDLEDDRILMEYRFD